ncbi:MAG TPA: DUF971 domain-containing protein [Pyrinomonadaceae bacterium]|nr:DUF971 domain-containing protein [Pyrinomonadaceae bacterium]
MVEVSERRGPAIEPREIKQEDDVSLSIAWGDGQKCRYRAADLRRACPCAQCVNEWTGQRTVKPETISDATVITDVSIVGRYALNFRWSDGHDTGIYSFRYLRDLCGDQFPPDAP